MDINSEYTGDGKIFHGFVPKVMGTRLDFIVVGEEKAAMEKLWEEACNEAGILDKTLNRFDPASEVSRFNGSYDEAPFQASPVLLDLVRISMGYRQKTCGLFDITRGKADCLSWDGDELQKFDPDVTLDFGGIAKGYFMAHLKSRLAAAGVKCAFVNFGESAILAVGRHPFGDSWQVTVPDPYGWKQVAQVSLVDSAFSTSGNTPAYSGHIINPLTGEAVQGKCIACVQSSDPLEAEVLSTALLAANEEQRKELRQTFADAIMNIYQL